MDESYMREYFERNQEVFYMRFRKDESKWTLEKDRAQAVDSSEKNTFMARLWKQILRQWLTQSGMMIMRHMY